MPFITDEEAIFYINELRTRFDLSEEQEDQYFSALESRFPRILAVIHNGLGTLTPEEILELAKKNDTPICL
jgi:hypothetical protein